MNETLAMNGNDARRWLIRQGMFLSISAAILLWVFETTRLDMRLADVFYDAGIRDFPLRHHWFFANVLHHGLKYAAMALGVAAFALSIAGMRGKLPWLPPRNALAAGLGMLLIPLGTSLLKHLTNRHCPWDVTDFGGYAPYVGLLADAPSGIVRGACFPAGHATAGFVWMVWAVTLRPQGLRPARLVLAGALLLGFVMGAGRMAQGAHFLSHTLWSAWFAWAVSIALAGMTRAELTFNPAARRSKQDSLGHF
jgi:membrane-associated PAP2 superfamily phosphatase